MKRLKFLILTILFAFLANSCSNPFNHPDASPAENLPAGKGSLSLSIAKTNGRTIMPTAFDHKDLSYELKFTPSSNGTPITEYFVYNDDNNGNVSINLDVGTYKVEVNAYAPQDNAHERPLFTGTVASIKIEAGKTATAEVKLSPVTDGIGTFSWDITFPANALTATMGIVEKNSADAPTPLFECNFGDDPRQVTGEQANLPPGFYDVFIEIEGINTESEKHLTVTRKEVLHIYNGYESVYKKSFADINFDFVYEVEFFNAEENDYEYMYVVHGDQLESKPDPTNRPEYDPEPGLYLDPVPSYYTFDGWYNGGTKWDFDDEVYSDMTLTAEWSVPELIADIAGDQIKEAIEYVAANADVNATYTLITLDGDINVASQIIDGSNFNLTMQGPAYAEAKLFLYPPGSPLFTINSGAKLTLGNNIVLKGVPNGTTALVHINGGTLVMEEGSKITGHTNTSGQGGGVLLANGTFNMKGGTVSDNTADNYGDGGGVFVADGTFNMTGGTISDNTASNSGGGVSIGHPMGGNPSFNMSGDSLITRNEGLFGGGVASNGTFNMSGGRISENKAVSDYGGINKGGGIALGGGTFTMEGGTVWGNEATADNPGDESLGGGVHLDAGAKFIMSGGTIGGSNPGEGNTASRGGGVSVDDPQSTFTMTGGKVLGNIASVSSGGVYIEVIDQLIIGGTAQIKGNTLSGAASNVCLPNGKYITLDEPFGVDSETDEPAEIYVQTATLSGAIVNTGASADDAKYFRADASGKIVVYEQNAGDDQLLLKSGGYINDENDLITLASSVKSGTLDTTDKYYLLMDDITLTDWATPISTYIDPFKGTFIGNGYTINFVTNGTLTYNIEEFYGLFSAIGEDGVVKNLNLEGSINLIGRNSYYVGAVAGKVYIGGTIENVSSSVEIEINGYGDIFVGGITGTNEGNIRNCFNIGSVTVNSLECSVGGVVGSNYDDGVLENCYSMGDVTTIENDDCYAGGVVGTNYGILKKCYATGAVGAIGLRSAAGGVVGKYQGVSTSSLRDCVALNAGVNGTTAGRVVGDFNTIGLANNYAWSGIKVNGTPAASGNDNDGNGSGMSANYFKTTPSWWQSGVSFTTPPWVLSDEYMPSLNGVGGDQPFDWPNHLQD